MILRTINVLVAILVATIAQAQVADSRPDKITALPDTGQSVRYTKTFGEDADFEGVSPKYVDNQDDTISDQVTGLMWQKTDGGEMTWESAQRYAQDCRLGGHRDWRLPTSIELFSIMDHGKHGPAMDPEFFTKTQARYWWSNATRADDKSKVWVVNTGGGIGAHAKSETISAGGDRPIHVRCVRGVSQLGAGPVLQENSDGTVFDRRTGLTWIALGATTAMTWEDALEYCSKLNHAGKNDWRLPNIKELRSLSDDRMIRPSIDPKFFPDAKAKFYWSSTSQSNRPERAWYVDFTTGLVTYADKTQACEVLAVRDETSVASSREKSEPDKKLLEQSSSKGNRQGGDSNGQRKKGPGKPSTNKID